MRIPPMAAPGDNEAEAKRILDRVSREADSGTLVDRVTRRARDHVTASDVGRDDWAEYWGTRVGRILALVLMGALIVWLVLFVTRGG